MCACASKELYDFEIGVMEGSAEHLSREGFLDLSHPRLQLFDLDLERGLEFLKLCVIHLRAKHTNSENAMCSEATRQGGG